MSEEVSASEGASSEAVVRTLLGVSGITPDDEEVAVLVQAFPALRASISSLYTLPDVRYGSPGLIFDPDPAFVAWK